MAHRYNYRWEFPVLLFSRELLPAETGTMARMLLPFDRCSLSSRTVLSALSAPVATNEEEVFPSI